MPSNDTTQAYEAPFDHNKSTHTPEVPVLDPSLYYLTEAEAAFFKATTGINNDEELKAHILMVQEKAYKVAPYPYIYIFGFLRMGIKTHPIYEDIVRIGRERKDAVFLDIGCCLATDAKIVAADGFPAHNIIASDLKKGFLELNHVLFRSSKETWPAHFIPGDAFDADLLSVVPIARGPTREPLPDLSALTSLNPLHGHCSVINASALFHFFDEEKQLHLARALAGLLSPQPGSIICGIQAAKEKGISSQIVCGTQLFAQSAKSWEEVWDGMIFEKGEAQVRVERKEIAFMENKVELLFWSVTRM